MKNINFKDLNFEETQEVNRALYAAIRLLDSRDYLHIDKALSPLLDHLRDEYSNSLQAYKDKKPLKLSDKTVTAEVLDQFLDILEDEAKKH